MMSFLLRVLLNALALWLTGWLYPGVHFARGTGAADVIVAGLALGVVNALIRPVLLFFSFPLTVLTLGLFTLVVNAVVLLIVAGLTRLDVAGFGAALVGAVVLSVVSWGLNLVLRPERRD